MNLIATLRQLLANIKGTTSGLVEYDNNNESLPAVHDEVTELLAERGIPRCQLITDLQSLTQDEAKIAYLEGAGLFLYDGSQAGLLSYQSTDGGWWNKYQTVVLAQLVNGTPANGNAPIWNTGQNAPVWGNPSVTTVGWTNITGKPTIPAKIVNIDTQRNVQVSGQTAQTGGSSFDNIALLTSAITGLTLGNDNVMFVFDATLTTGTVVANGNVIMGRFGSSLQSFVSGGLLAQILAFGINNQVVFSRNVGGVFTIGETGCTQTHHINGFLDSTVFIGVVTVRNAGNTASTTIAPGYIQSNAVIANQYMQASTWTTGTRPAPSSFPGGVIPNGVFGLNTTIPKMETYFNGTWI